MRAAKTNRVPKTRANGTWTEAAFLGFIRSGLRQMSRRWPPIAQYLRRHRREYHGENKRQKFEHQCAGCLHWYAAKELHVDHIEPCGPLRIDEAGEWIKRLFVEESGLRILCEACHEVRHQMELRGSP